ncbi:hypothetical protein [Streptomyces fragilis]|uniref:Secreted protein n=1 Tax=Streptomyces fragilis TaxID=67301 RepID=A0ABV2YH66_9ACTN|nr:hypothetical protein [Streptomyces fragilis]
MSTVIAIIALVLSVVSLLWQAWSWWRSGPIIEVAAGIDSPVFEGQRSDLAYHYIQAMNNGRAAATIEAFGVALPSGIRPISHTQEDLPAVEPCRLPYRLEPHFSARWYFTPQMLQGEEVRQTCRSWWYQAKVSAKVEVFRMSSTSPLGASTLA